MQKHLRDEHFGLGVFGLGWSGGAAEYHQWLMALRNQRTYASESTGRRVYALPDGRPWLLAEPEHIEIIEEK